MPDYAQGLLMEVVMKSAKEFWKDKFGELPTNDTERLAVVMMREYADYINQLKNPVSSGGVVDRSDAEEFLNTKDIWNHPIIADRNNKESYEVADLMAEFANKLNNQTGK